MGLLASRSSSRARWVALFASVLLVSSSVPVLAADSPPEEPPALAPASLQADPEGLPTAEDVSAGIEAIEREEAAHERWLESPEAVSQRQQSRFAYAGLTSAQAKELLGELFSEQLAKLNSDPARFLGDAQILSVADETVATVSEEGNRSLLEAGIPVRTENEEGELRKVDLGLIETPNGFEPVNPLTEVSIPLSAEEAVDVGEAGVSIAQTEAQSRSAERFGEENVFYSDVLTDTDLLVSPISHGVEIFNLLRSAESPETFRFEMDLPEGAELRASGGGAIVTHDGEAITKVLPPAAVDAQGTDVPVTMRVEGSSLVLDIEHREGDYARPILLDPTIMENWWDDNWMEGMSVEALSNGAWNWTSSPPGHISYSTYCINKCWGQGRGLYLSAQEIRTYDANVFSHWSYSAPNNDSFIEGAYLGSFERDNHGCLASQYPQPHVYDGFWGNGAWNELHIDRAGNPGYGGLESWGRSVIIGLGTGSNSAYLACKRDIVLGAIGIWLDDWNTPQINSVSGIPSGWVKDDLSLSVSASDPGLGVRLMKITNDGTGKVAEKIVNNCTGLHGARCPTSHTESFPGLSALSFGEGIRTANAVAEDPVNKTANHSFTTMVDRSEPRVALSGQLAQETSEVGEEEKPAGTGDELSLPVYNLTVKATDIGTESNSDHRKRSGVKDIEIWLDEKEMDVPWGPQPCAGPDYSCEMEKTYKLLLSKDVTTSGKHTLTVKVRDQVDNVRTRNIEFEYFPATGMKDEYLMHYFPLPDGTGNEAEEEHPDRPELAVNVMNGNLVYREQDIEVEGPGVDLEVERYYNSQLPTNENTEWGDGWTLAQTPDLKPVDTGGSPAPDEAELLESSGALEDDLQLPTETGAEKFDPELQATLTKKESGGFELRDETGESPTSVVFDSTGQTEALTTEGYAKVDYSYEGGELSEITVDDLGTAAYPPGGAPPVPGTYEGPPNHTASFGAEGTGNGQFDRPGDVAIAPNGDLWVADSYNNRIQHFDPKGAYLGKFGSKGTGEGQFERPRGIEFDDEGNLWILDTNNGRLQKFSQAGQFLAKFGTFGTAQGKFSSPKGLARDAQGNLWVADTGNGRIQKFSPSGTFLKSAGSSGPGDLTEPMGIDVSYEGEVFVADRTQNRVVVFNSEGEYVRAFGTAGEGEGELDGPVTLDVDPQGNVWVGEELNNRVQRFDLQGNYLGEFGSEGSGVGEMNDLGPMGITTDTEGSIWLTDTGNDRVQKWELKEPPIPPTYAASFGSYGGPNGQFRAPADVAIDAQGNLWVADKENHRIQKFDSTGKFLAAYGSQGSGNGQFNRPSSIAIDATGNILVADSNNHRIQKLSSAGAYVSKFGSSGSGNGQFNKPEEIVLDAEGNIWVADTQNGRVQKFNGAGEFLKVVDSGQLYEPTGMDIDPGGNLWVTDWQKNRLLLFDKAGEYKTKYGSSGSGKGQFNRPEAVEIDTEGDIWVGDALNQRIQRFNLDGQYVGQFGSAGSGAGQFSLDYPMGITTDAEGNLWITDVNNHRMQRWEMPAADPISEELLAGDPEVQVEVASDLVTAVEGEEAGEHSYEHEGDDLTSYEGPDGESTYEYDGQGRMTKVTLPNGTYAEIVYFSDGRVESVTVAPEGANAKTTNFEYTDEPRRTFAEVQGAPNVTYDIGEDGSILKWWNMQQSPTVNLAGTLYDYANEDGALFWGNHKLVVHGFSPEGIASLQVIANGNQLVKEKTCSLKAVECEDVETEWITHTDNHPRGRLDVEVLVTDQDGYSSSERFWVDIPEPPPIAPGTLVPPKFEDIARFREEYGLEVVFPVKSETELNERILQLITDWENGDAWARATMERWGVPLRPVDVAELEYRESLLEQAASIIPAWAQSNAPGKYAGFYMDHRSGGIIRIGFTANQNSTVDQLKANSGLMAPDRVQPFPYLPDRALASLETSLHTASQAITVPPAPSGIVSARIDVPRNVIQLGTTEVTQTEAFAVAEFGPGAGVSVVAEQPAQEFSGRFMGGVPFLAGTMIRNVEKMCMAGFGAWSRVGTRQNGDPIRRRYVMTAGHCFPQGELNASAIVSRMRSKNDTGVEIGTVERRGFFGDPDLIDTDAEAVWLSETSLVPSWVYDCCGGRSSLKVTGVDFPEVGETVCQSSYDIDRVTCGPVTNIADFDRLENPKTKKLSGWHWMIRAAVDGGGGDSGGPVWMQNTGAAVGLVAGGGEKGLAITPFRRPPGATAGQIAGIFSDPHLSPSAKPLHVQVDK